MPAPTLCCIMRLGQVPENCAIGGKESDGRVFLSGTTQLWCPRTPICGFPKFAQQLFSDPPFLLATTSVGLEAGRGGRDSRGLLAA
jgi:hypothetical protein